MAHLALQNQLLHHNALPEPQDYQCGCGLQDLLSDLQKIVHRHNGLLQVLHQELLQVLLLVLLQVLLHILQELLQAPLRVPHKVPLVLRTGSLPTAAAGATASA